jgi:hypothetical protein
MKIPETPKIETPKIETPKIETPDPVAELLAKVAALTASIDADRAARIATPRRSRRADLVSLASTLRIGEFRKYVGKTLAARGNRVEIVRIETAPKYGVIVRTSGGGVLNVSPESLEKIEEPKK